MNYFIGHGFMGTLLAGPMAGFFFGAIAILALWTITWKGIALWYAGRNHQKGWFIVLLILNTAGILEIIYLVFFRKNKNNEVHTTTVTHTVTASTPAPDMASSEASVPAASPVPPVAE